MKVLNANVGLVSNPEVLQLLHERGCHLGPVGNSLPAEQKTYAALSPFFPVIPTREQVQAFYDAVKPYKLDKASVLQLINLAPTSLVELFLVVPDCETRLTETQQQELLDLTKQHLSR